MVTLNVYGTVNITRDVEVDVRDGPKPDGGLPMYEQLMSYVAVNVGVLSGRARELGQGIIKYYDTGKPLSDKQMLCIIDLVKQIDAALSANRQPLPEPERISSAEAEQCINEFFDTVDNLPIKDVLDSEDLSTAPALGRYSRRLTEIQAYDIRVYLMEGWLIPELVRKYGVTKGVIENVRSFGGYRERESIPEGYIEWVKRNVKNKKLMSNIGKIKVNLNA